MRHRFSASIGLQAVVLAVVLAPQTPAVAQKWTPPRTPDGLPDMQGFWTNATFTPFERPSSLAGKEFFSDEEAVLSSRSDWRRRTTSRRTTSTMTTCSGCVRSCQSAVEPANVARGRSTRWPGSSANARGATARSGARGGKEDEQSVRREETDADRAMHLARDDADVRERRAGGHTRA